MWPGLAGQRALVPGPSGFQDPGGSFSAPVSLALGADEQGRSRRPSFLRGPGRVFVSCPLTHGQAASREAQQPRSGPAAPAKQRALSNPALCSPAPNQTAQQSSPQAGAQQPSSRKPSLNSHSHAPPSLVSWVV